MTLGSAGLPPTGTTMVIKCTLLLRGLEEIIMGAGFKMVYNMCLVDADEAQLLTFRMRSTRSNLHSLASNIPSDC